MAMAKAEGGDGGMGRSVAWAAWLHASCMLRIEGWIHGRNRGVAKDLPAHQRISTGDGARVSQSGADCCYETLAAVVLIQLTDVLRNTCSRWAGGAKMTVAGGGNGGG